MTTTPSTTPKRRRRGLQFSLRTLIVASNAARPQSRSLSGVVQTAVTVVEYSVVQPVFLRRGRRRPCYALDGPRFVLNMFAVDQATYFPSRSKPRRRMPNAIRSPAELLAFGLWFLVLAAVPCAATDRYFSDVVARSPNGRYRLSAKSPDNAEKAKTKPFQAGFVYSFCDTRSRAELWNRVQPEGEPIVLDAGELSSEPNKTWTFRRWEEGAPEALYVNDDGWSVLWLAGDDLVAMRSDGVETGKVDVYHALPEKDHEQFLQHTTAGPMWVTRHEYFASYQSGTYFVVRTWWNRRIIVNLASGAIEPDVNGLRKDLDETERLFAKRTLLAAIKDKKSWAKCCDGLPPVMMAIQIAGQRKMVDCVSSLRSLEDVPYVGSAAMVPFLMEEEVKEGELDLSSWETLTVRQAVQLSLRRLGEKPSCYAATRFDLQTHEPQNRRPYVPQSLETPRHLQVNAVRRGLSPSAVLQLIGQPDYVDSGVWEYDMDADPPYTLIVKLGRSGVTSVDVRRPPAWQDGFRRDRLVFQ